MGKKPRIRRLRPDQETVFPMLNTSDYEVTSDATLQLCCLRGR